MSTSRTLRFYDGEITGSTLMGEIAPPAPAPLGAAVGRLTELRYTAAAFVMDPDDPIKRMDFDGQVSHRPLQGINFLSAPVGSPCRFRVDLATDPPTVILFSVAETFLFDPCDAVVQGPNPPIITITPAPGRPPVEPPPALPAPGGL